MKRGSVCAVNLATDTFVEVKSVADFCWRPTDRPTPRGIEAPSRSLKTTQKIILMLSIFHFHLPVYLNNLK